MSLFDVPHPAKLGSGEPVLWFGVTLHHDTETHPPTVHAIVVDRNGRVELRSLYEVIADVRYVEDMSLYPALGREGPGWVDLEDMVVEPTMDVAKAVTQAILTDQPAVPYIQTPDGQKWDPVTNRPIDE